MYCLLVQICRCVQKRKSNNGMQPIKTNPQLRYALYQNCGSYLEQISYFNTNAPKLYYGCIWFCLVQQHTCFSNLSVNKFLLK